MGLLDSIISSVGGALAGNQQSGLIGMALQLLQNHPQGLQGLLDQFAKAGLGQQADSWVSTGPNMPLSAEQLLQALGSGKLQELARQHGLSKELAAGGLAAILPQIIDHLTPKGEVPQAGELDKLLSALKTTKAA